MSETTADERGDAVCSPRFKVMEVKPSTFILKPVPALVVESLSYGVAARTNKCDLPPSPWRSVPASMEINKWVIV